MYTCSKAIPITTMSYCIYYKSFLYTCQQQAHNSAAPRALSAKQSHRDNIQISKIQILKLERDRKLRILLNSRACPVSPKLLSSPLLCASLKFPSIFLYSTSPFHPSLSLLLPNQVPFGNSRMSFKTTCLLWDIPTCVMGIPTFRIQGTKPPIFGGKKKKVYFDSSHSFLLKNRKEFLPQNSSVLLQRTTVFTDTPLKQFYSSMNPLLR